MTPLWGGWVGVKEKWSRLPCAPLPALFCAKQAKVFLSCCFSVRVRCHDTPDLAPWTMSRKQIVPHPLMLTIREGHHVCYKYLKICYQDFTVKQNKNSWCVLIRSLSLFVHSYCIIMTFHKKKMPLINSDYTGANSINQFKCWCETPNIHHYLAALSLFTVLKHNLSPSLNWQIAFSV